MTSKNKNAGFIIALVAGGVGLLTFFAIPFISTSGYFGSFSYTAQQIAALAAQFGTSSNGGQLLVILWAAPVVAGLTMLIAALQFRSTVQPASHRVATGWLIVLGIVGIVLYVGILIYINSQSTSTSPSIFSYLGAGFWIYILAMVGVIVGASVALSGKAQAQAISGPPPVSTSYPPYQPPPPPTQYPPQYPPYQQPWAQQSQYPPTERAPESPQWPPSQPDR